MTFKYKILLVSICMIESTTDIGRFMLFTPYSTVHISILVPQLLQIILHCLVMHIDFIFLVGNSGESVVVDFDDF
jgi:hypothetical protein